MHRGTRRCDISAAARPSSSASFPNLLIDSARDTTWLLPDPWACFQVPALPVTRLSQCGPLWMKPGPKASVAPS